MLEIYVRPEFIDQEKKRLEEADAAASETKILQLLINVYGGTNIANYLIWNVERLKENETYTR